MIDIRVQVIDLNPLQYSRFSRVFDRLSSVRPQLVLWHEESMPRRQLIDGRAEPIGAYRIDDARDTARELFESYRKKLRRVVVTDLDGYDRLYAAHNLNPEPNEDKYHYLERMYQAVRAEFDKNVAIYPEPILDRGPVSYRRIRSFVEHLQPDPCCLILAVFDGQSLFFSLVAGVSHGKVDLVTSFEHWGKALSDVRFTGLELDRVKKLIGEKFHPVAGALFISRQDFFRLFNGESHEGRPESLPLGSMAFGYSVRPDSLQQTLLDTAGLFAYAPVRIP
jgi:hypothetical protein